MIPYGRQSISDADVDAVIKVLRSDYLTQGPAVPSFEQAVAKIVGSKHGVAFNSATSALHSACLALGVSEGDLVWTSPISFVASANCALYCGADIDFVDVDVATSNISISALTNKLEAAARHGKLPKVVIPVHMGGLSCDMKALADLANRFQFRIIEDASHAIGGKYECQPIGDCRYSDITVFSFHPVKIITTGEGGMAMTQNDELAARLRLYCSHGITKNPDDFVQSADGDWYYEQQLLGFNYRMTDLQAALGRSQCARIEEFIAKRQQLAIRYDELLADLPVELPGKKKNASSSFHLYAVRIMGTEKRKEVFRALRTAGIFVNVHYIPIYHQPFYRKRGFARGYCANAELYYENAISLPIYPSMTRIEQDFVVEQLRRSL